MKQKSLNSFTYGGGVSEILGLSRKRQWIASILVSSLLSGSIGPNTEKGIVCEIGPRYSTINNDILEIRDCKTGTVLKILDISGLLNAPLK